MKRIFRILLNVVITTAIAFVSSSNSFNLKMLLTVVLLAVVQATLNEYGKK